MNASIQLVSPFPPEHYPLFWSWLNEFPVHNFDDSAPRNVSQLADLIEERERRGRVWEVLCDGEPVGAIGYKQESAVTGGFDGICFAEAVHGTGVALTAVAQVLDAVFNAGTKNMYACMFAGNERCAAFLAKFGAVDELLVESETRRGGEVVTWRVVRIAENAFRENQRYQFNSQRIGASKALSAYAR